MEFLGYTYLDAVVVVALAKDGQQVESPLPVSLAWLC